MFNSFYFNDFFFLIPELFLLVFIFIIFIFCIIFSNKTLEFKNQQFFPILVRSCFFLSIYILFITFLLLLNFNNIFSFSTVILLNSHLIINEFIHFFKLLIILSCFCLLLINYCYFKYEKIYQYEFIIIILLSIFSILLLISSFNLLTLYLSLELLSLSLYILVAMKQHSKYSTEAALKYFILGVFSSGLLLYGFSFLYGLTGLVNFDDLQYFFFYFNFIEFS